jgi:hypothetical protein
VILEINDLLDFSVDFFGIIIYYVILRKHTFNERKYD